MKSLQDLAAMRSKTQPLLDTSAEAGRARILVGMGTCGNAAGAKPVMAAFQEELARRDMTEVSLLQTGCIGICQYEPVVEVTMPGHDKVTYVKMSPTKVARIVAEHIAGGHPVTEYTIGAATNQ